MKTRLMTSLLLVTALSLLTSRALAHCQIPCGIYDDPLRFKLMAEHITTIEKSMNELAHLSAEHDKPDYNQLVRWVQNKEDHANQFTEIVTFYFLAQRIKPADPANKAAFDKYVHELTLLHQMMVHAMKAKQTTDLEQVKTLRSLLKQFETSYLGAK